MVLKGNEVSTEKALKSKLISKRRLIQLPQWGVAWLALLPALIFLTMFMTIQTFNNIVKRRFPIHFNPLIILLNHRAS